VKPLLVLGMLRSGTSATTRALGLLGASMGPESDMGMFWENQPMRRVNRDLLGLYGGDWECPPVLPDGWLQSTEVQALIPRAKEVVAQEYGGASVMVWKDPRTCLTLPFWVEVLGETPIVVLLNRHPVEIASSAEKRNQLSRGHAFAVWERFLGDAVSTAVGLPTAVVDYVQLVNDPVTTMSALVDTLAEWGAPLPGDPATTEMELTPQRRHHHAATGEVFDDPIATDSQRVLFTLLRELPAASDAFALPRPVPTPDPLSTELLALAGQVFVARRDEREARDELHQLAGSRRRILRRLVGQTLPFTAGAGSDR
jgi:hypothetical protein